MAVTGGEPPTPPVSIVMVASGGRSWAGASIDALVEHTHLPFHLVVVDDATSDGSGEAIVPRVPGAHLVSLDEPVGFAAAANRGALEADGEYLCFLAADVVVTAGWLGALASVLVRDPSVAAVVPMVLGTDGAVLEAGVSLDASGGVLRYGAGADPDDAAVGFRRQVSAGSAACMLIRRRAFREVGGFAPAGEDRVADVDLCVAVDDRGGATVYEPAARVRRQRQRGEPGTLALTPPSMARGDGSRVTSVAWRDYGTSDRILVIDDRVPNHDRGAGDPRMRSLLRELVALWPSARITFFAAGNENAERYAPALLAEGVEVVWDVDDADIWFEERRYHYSVVILSRPNNMTRFDPVLRRTQPQALRVFDIEALFFRRLEQMEFLARTELDRVALEELTRRDRAAEIDAISTADILFCLTEEEQSIARGIAPMTESFLLAHHVPVREQPPGYDGRSGILFFGGFMAGAGSPNEDTVRYVVRQVLPHLWAHDPELVFHVVGADPTEAVRALDSDRVHVVGYVDDPQPWFDRTLVHVAPVRFGAGLKLKFVDTMAAGQPFVTSTVGAEGFGLGPLADALVADEPQEIAELVRRLCTDRESWERAQQGLLELARQRFGRERFRRELIEAMSHVGVAPPS